MMEETRPQPLGPTHLRTLIHPHLLTSRHPRKQAFQKGKTVTFLLPTLAPSVFLPHSTIFCNISGQGIGVDA